MKNECEFFIKGSKHRERDEITTPKAAGFYCFDVFGTLDEKRSKVFDMAHRTRAGI